MRFRDIKDGQWYRVDISGRTFAKARVFKTYNGETLIRMWHGISPYEFFLINTGTGVSPATEEEVKAFKKDLLKKYKAQIDAL